MEAHAGAQACGTQAPEAAATEPLTLESLLSADVDVLDLICGYEDGLRGFGRETVGFRALQVVSHGLLSTLQLLRPAVTLHCSSVDEAVRIQEKTLWSIGKLTLAPPADNLSRLQLCSRMHTLTLNGPPALQLPWLAHCERLRSLRLINVIGLRLVSFGCVRLPIEDLTLTCCTDLGDALAALLPHLRLRSLTFFSCSGPLDLSFLSGCSTLRRLKLARHQGAVSHLTALTSCPALAELRISGMGCVDKTRRWLESECPRLNVRTLSIGC